MTNVRSNPIRSFSWNRSSRLYRDGGRMADTLPGSITIVCSLTGPSPACVGDRTDKPSGLGFNSDQQEPVNALDYRGIRPEQRLYLI